MKEIDEALFFYLFERAEKRLPSGTASILRKQLQDEGNFKKFKDADWMAFGKRAKKLRGTGSVFTGSLAEMVAYLMRNPKGLPVTPSFAEKSIIRKGRVRMKDLSGGKFLGLLERDGFLDIAQVTAKEALKANHTNEDKKLAKSSPRTKVSIWFAGDNLKNILKLLKGKGVNIKAESIESFEKKELTELFSA